MAILNQSALIKYFKFLSRYHYSRLFSFLLLPVLFTLGFILGVIYNSSLSSVECVTENHVAEKSLPNFAHVVVVILSSPDNTEQRQVIRNTWLLTKGNNSIKHYFALSIGSLNTRRLAQLKDEHSKHQDLILLNSFTDSYSKLSDKIKQVLKWVDSNCQYKFLLKVDDDSFVQLNALSKTLSWLPQRKLYWGFFDGQASVKTRGRWKERNWFLCDRYLPYAKGGGYVLSQDLVHLLTSVSDSLVSYQNEDVSVGVWLAPFKIHRVHEPNFDTEYQSRGCFNSYLITHKQTPSMMQQKYKNLKDTGYLCSSEQRVRNSYMYNWQVLPSKCCERTEKLP